jgi:hypothetical protein
MTLTSRDLRARVFNALPAATFQMDQLLGMLDVVADRSVPTAAVECTKRPRLLINPDFVEQYCPRDEHLLTLVLHELYHVILGHTRLFPRATRIQNIAFDAVINAMLARQLLGKECIEFLCSLNAADTFPACLLRPPEGWPARSVFPDGLPEGAQALIERLYGELGDQVTYHDVFEQLKSGLESTGLELSEVVLLGDHDDRNGDGAHDAIATEDPLLEDILSKIVASWPQPPFHIAGRDAGRAPELFQLNSDKKKRRKFTSAVQSLLRSAGMHPRSRGRRARMQRVPVERVSETVVPQSSDRRAHALTRLWGQPPIFWKETVHEITARPRPREIAHVYLDVSGSMTSVLPALVRALEKPHREGLCRTFGFSCIVDEIPPGKLSGACLDNNWGTSLDAVLHHLLQIPFARRPRHVVVFTDGWVGKPDSGMVKGLLDGGLRMHVGIVNGNGGSDFASLTQNIKQLPTVDFDD